MKKVIIISVSVLLVLLILVCSLVGYLDMLPGKPIPWDTVTMDSTGTVYYAGNLIRTNGLGTVVVAKNNLEPGDQRIAAWKGVFLDRISTHLTMLSLRKGMSLPQVIAAAGMPDGTSGLGIVCLDYNTPDGYTYAIYFSQRTAGGDQAGQFDLYHGDRAPARHHPDCLGRRQSPPALRDRPADDRLGDRRLPFRIAVPVLPCGSQAGLGSHQGHRQTDSVRAEGPGAAAEYQ